MMDPDPNLSQSLNHNLNLNLNPSLSLKLQMPSRCHAVTLPITTVLMTTALLPRSFMKCDAALILKLTTINNKTVVQCGLSLSSFPLVKAVMDVSMTHHWRPLWKYVQLRVLVCVLLKKSKELVLPAQDVVTMLIRSGPARNVLTSLNLNLSLSHSLSLNLSLSHNHNHNLSPSLNPNHPVVPKVCL
jgi:hypothetical protein